MKILVDMQPALASSKDRGLGRYCLELTKALIKLRGQEIHLLLNGAYSASIVKIRKKLESMLPNENFHIWYPVTPWSGFANTGS